MDFILFSAVMLLGTFIAAVSQVFLKKSAIKEHDSAVKEYMNPTVLFAYALFIASTLMTVIAYKGIPLSMGPVLAATSYVYVTIFSVCIFKEKVDRTKLMALFLILFGIGIYSISVV